MMDTKTLLWVLRNDLDTEWMKTQENLDTLNVTSAFMCGVYESCIDSAKRHMDQYEKDMEKEMDK